MLILLNNQTVDSLQVGIDRIAEYVYKALRDRNIPEKIWDGDLINIDTQLPKWIQDTYVTNPNNAPVVDFFKYYYRWLFDYEDGYGCGFYIENFRNILKIQSDFLQPYADDVFGGTFDLSSYPELIENFRKFYLSHDRDYVRIRGTPEGISYLIKSLFGATTVSVVTLSPTSIQITTNVSSSYETLIKTLGCPFGFNVTFVYV